MFIVKLDDEYWLAPWNGDPGLTTIKYFAQRYESKKDAEIALTKARKYKDFPQAEIINLKEIK